MSIKLGRLASKPDSDRLYEFAESQEGHFTTAQAADAGYSSQLLAKYLKAGRILRIRRGVYRLVQFPPGENEDLVVIWLWSEREGVFSHETALALHGLSDALPSVTHLSLPEEWRSRRLRVPRGVELHYADVEVAERSWVAAVPVTSPSRTVLMCAAEGAEPILVEQAVSEGIDRGLFTVAMVESAQDYARLHTAAED